MSDKPSLICFDLDGTVYKPAWHRMTPRVERAFIAAHRAGIPTCVVSGRPWPMIDRHLRAALWLDWCVTVNGATIWRRSPKQLIATHPIAHDCALDMIDALSDLRPSWFLFTNEREYFEASAASYLFGRWDRIMGKLFRHLPMRLLTPVTRLKGFDLTRSARSVLENRSLSPTKINCNFPSPDNLEEGVRRLRDRADLEIVRMWYGELEITNGGVTKGSAIDELCAHIGADPARAVMFGDSANDLPVVGHVGTFVAVENASDEVKSRADEVCPSVENDGVAVWIERMLAG